MEVKTSSNSRKRLSNSGHPLRSDRIPIFNFDNICTTQEKFRRFRSPECDNCCRDCDSGTSETQDDSERYFFKSSLTKFSTTEFLLKNCLPETKEVGPKVTATLRLKERCKHVIYMNVTTEMIPTSCHVLKFCINM